MAFRTSLNSPAAVESLFNALPHDVRGTASVTLILVAFTLGALFYIALTSLKNAQRKHSVSRALPLTKNDVDLETQGPQAASVNQTQESQLQAPPPTANLKKKRSQRQRKAASRKATAAPSLHDGMTTQNDAASLAGLLAEADVKADPCNLEEEDELHTCTNMFTDDNAIVHESLYSDDDEDGGFQRVENVPPSLNTYSGAGTGSEGSSSFSRSLLLAHREISIKISRGPPGLELPAWLQEGPPGLHHSRGLHTVKTLA